MGAAEEGVASGPNAADLLQAVIEATGRPLTEDERAYCDESCLRRYLRARAGDIRKACKLLCGTLQWRSEFGINSLHVGEFESDLSTGKMFVAGPDTLGHPILITRKRADRMEGGSDHYLRHLAFTLETACRAMRNGQEQWVWILDMAGYTRANSPPLSVSMATLRILADRYPERLAKVFMVDAPAVFSILFTALSPFIDPATRAKVEFIKSADYRARIGATATDAGPIAGSQEAAAGDTTAAGAKALAFEKYWSYYSAAYDEAQYRRLLQEVGWPQ